MNRRPAGIALLIILLLPLYGAAAVFFSATAHADDNDPRQYCTRVANDDRLRSPPSALAAAIKRLFGVSGEYAWKTTYFRCADGKVLLCTVGANLSCGKADQRRVLPPANHWCRENPNADIIPMAVTGHDTLYVWRCVGRRAKPAGEVGKIDKRGFFAANWKVLQ